MKRFTTLLLIVAMFLTISACGNHSEDYEVPAVFYYLQSEETMDLGESIICGEIRETAHLSGNLNEILNLYLEGPIADSCTSPFPDNLFVLSIERSGDRLTMMLSHSFNKLQDLDLSVAAICISMTLFELTDCNEIELCTLDKLSNGKDSVILTRDLLYLSDSSRD